jgi:hypothetical protein
VPLRLKIDKLYLLSSLKPVYIFAHQRANRGTAFILIILKTIEVANAWANGDISHLHGKDCALLMMSKQHRKNNYKVYEIDCVPLA